MQFEFNGSHEENVFVYFKGNFAVFVIKGFDLLLYGA